MTGRVLERRGANQSYGGKSCNIFGSNGFEVQLRIAFRLNEFFEM